MSRPSKTRISDVYNKLLSRSEIGEMILCHKPFLLTGEAWVFGSSLDNLDKIVAFSMITEEDCKGHFGPKFLSGQQQLRIPLLHLSRIMIMTAQIAIGAFRPEMIAILIKTEKVKANNQNLISPPAAITSIATDFEFKDNGFSARAFARANGEPYAEIQKLTFELMPKDRFNRIDNPLGAIPRQILKGYKVKREMYRSEIEELILERQPFHRLDRAILMESPSGNLRLITISNIYQQDCQGQLVINNKSTILPIDYARLMALTAELLASIVTRERFNGFSVVPIAVRVEQVDTPSLLFCSPPATIVAETDISAENLRNPVIVKRGKKIFWTDSASAWMHNTEVAKMDKIVYALIPEEEFIEGTKKI